jgi:plasmid stabilization system protein ParE
MTIVISERAEEDLARIYAWIEIDHDSEAAERFRIRAERALSQLKQHPYLGPQPAWATRHNLLRFWLITRTNYIIYYEPRGEEIFVERVLNGRRDVHRIIELKIEEAPDDANESEE